MLWSLIMFKLKVVKWLEDCINIKLKQIIYGEMTSLFVFAVHNDWNFACWVFFLNPSVGYIGI